jgi:hypothetical protein
VGFLFWPVAVILGGVCVFYSLKGLAQKRTFKESDGVTGLYVTLVLGILEIIGALLIWVAVFGGFK